MGDIHWYEVWDIEDVIWSSYKGSMLNKLSNKGTDWVFFPVQSFTCGLLVSTNYTWKVFLMVIFWIQGIEFKNTFFLETVKLTGPH